MRLRLLAAFVGVALVILAAQDIPLARFVRSVERDRLLASLERDAFVIGGVAESSLSGDDDADPERLQASIELYQARNGADVVVTDDAGVAVAVSDDSARVGDDFSTRPEIAQALAGNPVTGERFSNSLGYDLAYVAVPVRSGPTVVGAVRLTYPASVIDDRASDTVRGIALVAFISLIGAGVAAVFIASTISRPILRLQRTTERVTAGDLSARAAIDEGPPEVRRLATSFNTMTDRVKLLLDQQRSFAGDASHQLRTPLTALRLQLERAGDMIDDDPSGARQRIEAAGAETERLQRLVEGLLMLARADRSGAAAVPVDVGALVHERVEMWAPLALERDLFVRAALTVPTHGPMALAVPQALEQIVDNFLDNAIGIVPSGTIIELTVAETTDADGRWVSVHVLDQGPGMTTEQLEHARDRFWRAADAPHQGSGLGLAIVDHLARASGGMLLLTNRPGGGLDAAVRLRVAG